MSRTFSLPWVVLAGVLFLAGPPLLAEVQAEEPAVRDIVVGLRGRKLSVAARLEPPPPAEILARLSTGLPTTSSWEIRLYSARNFWFDAFRSERKYEVTATYRPLNSDWIVERRLEGSLLESSMVPTLREAEAALVRLPEFVAFTFTELLAGKPLVVKLRCTYGAGIALGIVPTTIDSGWARSPNFVWNGDRP